MKKIISVFFCLCLTVTQWSLASQIPDERVAQALKEAGRKIDTLKKELHSIRIMVRNHEGPIGQLQKIAHMIQLIEKDLGGTSFLVRGSPKRLERLVIAYRSLDTLVPLIDHLQIGIFFKPLRTMYRVYADLFKLLGNTLFELTRTNDMQPSFGAVTPSLNKLSEIAHLLSANLNGFKIWPVPMEVQD